MEFKTTDPQEIKRIAKSDDMARMLFQLQHNFTRQWKDLDITLDNLNAKLTELFEQYKIDIDDLID